MNVASSQLSHSCNCLRSTRQEAGLTQKEFADALGVHQSFVSKSTDSLTTVNYLAYVASVKQCNVSMVASPRNSLAPVTSTVLEKGGAQHETKV